MFYYSSLSGSSGGFIRGLLEALEIPTCRSLHFHTPAQVQIPRASHGPPCSRVPPALPTMRLLHRPGGMQAARVGWCLTRAGTRTQGCNPEMDIEGSTLERGGHIAQSEVIQTEKGKYHLIQFIGEVWENDTDELIYKPQTEPQQRKQTYGSQRGKGGEG